MDEKDISINRMAELANVQYRIVKKYYEQKSIRIDLEILAKFCYILECDISDILCYQSPSSNLTQHNSNLDKCI